MKKFLLTLLFFFSFLFLFKNNALANDKFDSTVNVTYAVEETGITHATTNITITNTTANFYVSSYTLKLGFDDISNVKASDSGGPIIPVIRKTDSGQEITLTFNSIVYGKDSKLPFTLSFDTPNIATKNGDIWEVNIPGLASQNEFSDFTVNVVVPSTFGKPTYIKPEQSSDSLTFTKDQLGKSGISIAFGKSQIYDFRLLYHLENKDLLPITTDVALPPNTNYQDVYITSMTPKPTNVRVDKDGNWLATYSLAPSQKVDVEVDGAVSVSLYPKESDLSKSDKILYTEPEKYWQQSSDIKNLAAKLKTPEAIYNYVVSTLQYDFSRVNDSQERLGAQAVLQKPNSAVCLEFSDLFVALARAAGIPAREIDGYAYTQNTKERPLSLVQDILHAWPEYYDDTAKQWVMVDPTWGNTTGGVDYFHTFDFDHIAFTIKGSSSTFPIPAGGYKLPEDINKKDVDVSFGILPDSVEPTIDASLIMETTFMSAFPISGTVVLRNTSTTIFPSQKFSVLTSGLLPTNQTLIAEDIPPYGNVSIPFSFNKTPLLTNKHTAITIAIAGEQISKRITIIPFTFQQLLIGGVILAILCITIFVAATKTRRVSIPK
ncbi:MAG TPA: transglutaminase family protein [Patescibacteria group bacterium]